jgi:hypothetical protein
MFDFSMWPFGVETLRWGQVVKACRGPLQFGLKSLQPTSLYNGTVSTRSPHHYLTTHSRTEVSFEETCPALSFIKMKHVGCFLTPSPDLSGSTPLYIPFLFHPCRFFWYVFQSCCNFWPFSCDVLGLDGYGCWGLCSWVWVL